MAGLGQGRHRHVRAVVSALGSPEGRFQTLQEVPRPLYQNPEIPRGLTSSCSPDDDRLDSHLEAHEQDSVKAMSPSTWA